MKSDMAVRAKRTLHGNKAKVSVTLDVDLYEWALAHTGGGKRFSSLSHALEQGLAALRDAEPRKRS